jgi:N utilization substance protein A
MDKQQLIATVKQICAEKNISAEAVQETIEAALAAAYRKDFGDKNTQNIVVEFDMQTGNSRVFDVKEVIEDIPVEILERQEERRQKIAAGEEVEELAEDDELNQYVFNPRAQIQLTDAKKIKKSYKVGDEIRTELDVPDDYGRMAAQTAKQVIIQKLREAERHVLFEDFSAKEGDLVMGIVQRRNPRFILVDLGRITAILPMEEQVPHERYYPGDRIRVLVLSVNETTKGPEVLVSRVNSGFIKALFALEIPEIAAGTVKINGVAREAGFRAKVAVSTEDESIDPIGACIGQKGSRIQTIITELAGEKIDIIEWSEDPEEFIIQSMSPAKISRLELDHDAKIATVFVVSDQLSLAIGKSGQNVRLASQLTGWTIDIKEFVTMGVGEVGESTEEVEGEVDGE